MRPMSVLSGMNGAAMGLCYTSGTTGHPKGVLYSHRSMYLHTMGVNQANAFGLTERDNVLAVVPQFHAMCWGLPYGAALAGANLVMPGPFLDAASLAELLHDRRITVAAGVPTIWNSLYHELKRNPVDISSIRALIVGGSAMPRPLIKAYEQELGVNVMHAWGMTETSPIGSVCVASIPTPGSGSGGCVGCQSPPGTARGRRRPAHCTG